MPKLIAIESFSYKARNVTAGKEFDADDADVAILTRSLRPRAKETEAGAVESKEPKSPDAAATESELFGAGASPKGRRYNRRDMRAKD